VFVGGGGKFRSVNGSSGLSTDDWSSLDSVSDDSVVSEDDVEASISISVVAPGVIVSARERAMKRPDERGCSFQASVNDCFGVKGTGTQCEHDAVDT